ncbi:leucine-rich repeat domain-containing protein, partial [Ruminococcus sp.]|uniref:leucine-rich repeat domain-containing protein n=1 Tax=Ruminococcus sp. TaxID=41978 RepID=UPI0025E8C316
GIASGAFDGCTSLNSINIPDNIRIIEDYTFCDCTSLKQLFLSRNISHIYSRALENCTLLEKITIYDKIEYIADNAFEGCDKLTIYGIKGSYAEQYANEHNIPFEELDTIY